MSSQLQSLIDKIKSEGIAEAEAHAADIVSQAEKKASLLVRAAMGEAEDTVSHARVEAARAVDAGNRALEQAGRNLVLAVQQKIVELFERLLREEIKAALAPEALATILTSVVESWQPGGAIEVSLRPGDEQALADGMLKKLQGTVKGGLTLKPVASVDAGFTVAQRDGNLFFDFTASAMAQMLSQYLNPKLAAVLRVDT